MCALHGMGESMSKTSFAALIMTFALGGCASAVITDIGEDKVRVHEWGNPDLAYAEAKRGCEIYNREPVAVSEFKGSDSWGLSRNFLFACKPNMVARPNVAQATPNQYARPSGVASNIPLPSSDRWANDEQR